LLSTTSLQARVVTRGDERLGPWTSMGELTNGVVDLAKSSERSDMKACRLMDQGAQTKRWIKWMKIDIGFKDDEMINNPEVIDEGNLIGFSDN
jgi:hypothetical protein